MALDIVKSFKCHLAHMGVKGLNSCALGSAFCSGNDIAKGLFHNTLFCHFDRLGVPILQRVKARPR